MNFIIVGIRTGLDDVNIFLKTYHSENVLCSVTVGGQESDKSVYSSSRNTFNLHFHKYDMGRGLRLEITTQETRCQELYTPHRDRTR